MWQKIQRKTFARWVNNVLEPRQMTCSDNLEEELKSGVVLYNLLELMTEKKLPKINDKPKIGIQKIENLNKCLKFIQAEGIVLVGVGAEDLHDGRTKLVLGMIWTFILRYHLEGEEGDEEMGGRSALLEWCNNVLNPQGLSVSNFTSSWKDGRAFCGLVNALEPGVINLADCPPENAVSNLDRSFDESWTRFHFPKLLDAIEVAETPDELSILTYVSYFRQYLSKHTAFAANCYAEGPGLTDALTFTPATFTVFACDEAGARVTRGGAFIKCSLLDKNKKHVAKVAIKDNLDGTYLCTYEAECPPGVYDLHVKVGSVPIKDSPFHPEIIPGEPDPIKCIASGPGLSQAVAGEKSEFTIQMKNFKDENIKKGGATVLATLKDPSGDIPVTVQDNRDGTYTCTYVPRTADDLKLDIKLKTIAFGTGDVQGAPFTVSVTPGAPSANHTFATGDGLTLATAGVSSPITIQVMDEFGNAVKSGGAPIKGTLTYLTENLPPVDLEVFDNNDGTFTANYTLDKAGDYTLDLKLGDAPIKDAPFDLHVDPASTSVENAEVTWLGNPVAGTTAGRVQLRDQFMNLQFKGGDKVVAEFVPKTPASVTAVDKGDGTYDIVYPLGVKGKHKVSVKVNGKPVPGGDRDVEIEDKPVPEETKKEVTKVLPHSAHILNRLLAKANGAEQASLLRELSSFKS